MFNAIATDLSLPIAHRHEQPVKPLCPKPDNLVSSRQRDLLQAVIASLGGTIGPLLLPSMMPHLLHGIGRELGRRFCGPVETAQTAGRSAGHEADPGSTDDQFLDGLHRLEAQWGCRHQIVRRSPDRIELAILDCPVESQGNQPLHLCWLYAGMLGEVAGNRLEYAKVSVLPGTWTGPLGDASAAAASDEACRLTLYLQKTAESAAADGTTYPQARQTIERLPPRARTGLPLDRLSDREWQVLRLIGEGFSDKEIASSLKMSVRTAENHASRIYTKLGVRGRARLIRYALRHNVVNV